METTPDTRRTVLEAPDATALRDIRSLRRFLDLAERGQASTVHSGIADRTFDRLLAHLEGR